MKKTRSITDVTKVTDINMNYINAFIKTAAETDIDWIEETFKKCREEAVESIRSNHPALDEEEVQRRADRQYFGAFRAEFARKYHPELLADKKKTLKKNSLMDAISNRRAALTA